MIILQFTPQELAILDRALIDRPYREVAPLIASINRQLRPRPGDSFETPKEDDGPAEQ